MKRMDLQNHPIFAMAQPAALPGSCQHSGISIQHISDALLEEIRILLDGGIDGVILQNFHDGPVKHSAAPETTAYLTRLACDIKRVYPDVLLGILVCWDGPASIMVAEAAQADFIRVEHVYCGAELTACGIIEGQCAEVQQTKRKLGASVSVFADVYEPHSVPLLPQPLESAAIDCVYGGLADGLFLCGKSWQESIEYAGRVRSVLPDVPLVCGGGSNAENVGALLESFDGVCVGSWIKNGNLANPVSQSRLTQYMDAVWAARDSAEKKV